MIGMREILKHFSNISTSEVVGMRAPYLKPGRNTQYKVLEDFGYIYDSSIGISPLKVPIWPYTLDYKIPHECKAGTCPTKSFQGNEKCDEDSVPMQNMKNCKTAKEKVEKMYCYFNKQ